MRAGVVHWERDHKQVQVPMTSLPRTRAQYAMKRLSRPVRRYKPTEVSKLQKVGKLR